MSAPHTGVLTCTVGKQRRAELGGGPDRCCLLEDLAFLFVLLQSSAAGGRAHTVSANTKSEGLQWEKCYADWSACHKVAAVYCRLVRRPQTSLAKFGSDGILAGILLL